MRACRALHLLMLGATLAGCPSRPAPPPPLAPRPATAAAAPSQPPPSGAYVGSAACKPCHAAIYDRWKRTRMANVVRDPREHPDAILPDLSKPDPLVTFTEATSPSCTGASGSSATSRAWATTTSRCPRSGTSRTACGAVLRRRRHRLVGAVLPGRQLPAPDRTPVRRLPLRRTTTSHTKTVDRVERGLRALPRTGRRARAAAGAGEHRQPGRARRLHANDVCIQCHSQGRPLDESHRGA